MLKQILNRKNDQQKKKMCKQINGRYIQSSMSFDIFFYILNKLNHYINARAFFLAMFPYYQFFWANFKLKFSLAKKRVLYKVNFCVGLFENFPNESPIHRWEGQNVIFGLCSPKQ